MLINGNDLIEIVTNFAFSNKEISNREEYKDKFANCLICTGYRVFEPIDENDDYEDEENLFPKGYNDDNYPWGMNNQ